ncbi:cadherin domain-containing protein [Verrucomicrobiaceae bacterium N1E253]|uniref:Cadherin domain-containing protein n=1 Tax=Oceaniferula marina TaxID=2748318 RepID=A0A851GCI7_9BACT|nr:cadherin domain-containing protein [Oceaniferula marina]NWK55283.1 cadherin domain-containing protein [Oceaniferula marina]
MKTHTTHERWGRAGGLLPSVLGRFGQHSILLMTFCSSAYALEIEIPTVAVTTVGQAKTFSQSGHDPVTLSGVLDVADTLTLSVTSGTLSLSGTTGLTFVAGDGVSDSTMTFSGSLADVNAALEGLSFLPSSGAAGSVTMNLTVAGTQSVTNSLKLAVNAAIDAEAARDQILAGVSSLADPTQPGRMVVYGDSACSISNYPGAGIDNPMVAGARWGAGKVIAMPDHQWLNMGSYGGDASTGTFYTNGMAWLAGSTSLGVKVVTYNNQANADWLIAQGFTNVVNTTAANLATDLVGADVFVAGWIGTSISQSMSDTIRDYVTAGGGLFISEYGPGYSWWWGKSTEDIPGNILLREAGIGFTQAWPAGGVQTINRGSGQMTGDDVLAIIQTPGSYSESEKNLAASIFDKLNAVLKETDPLQLQLDDVFWTKIATINPTPTTPVSDSLEKALLNREGQILRELPVAQMTAHRTALPVGASAARVNKSVTLPETVAGHDYWVIDTGLYAAPGEVVSITVPAALVGIGLDVQIGHLRTDTGDTNYYTMPYQQLFFDVDTATLDVASPHGGLLMFVAPSGTEWTGAQSVQVNGAVEAPYFEYGVNTNAEWIAGVRDRETPFGVLVSDTHVLVIESEQYLRSLDNPEGVMEIHRNMIWWIDDFYNYHRGRPLRTHHDYQPVGGASSMPLSYGMGSNITDYDSLVVGGEALTMHEHGHHADHNNILFHEFGETAPNLGGKYAQQMYLPFSWKQELDVGRINNYQRSLTDDLWNHYNHYAVDVKGTFYDSVGAVFGWDKIRTIVHAISNDATISTAQDKLDALLVHMSQTVGYDVSPFLQQWQLSFSATALSTVSVLPQWNMVETVGEDIITKQDAAVTFGNPSLNDFSYDGTLTFTGMTNPTSGSLVDNGNGTYTYTPNAGFTGDDVIQYTVVNATGNTYTGTINITVNAAANYPTFESGDTHVSTTGWTTVNLGESYSSMVVVAQPVVTESTPPVVTRIRNASGNSFEVMLQRADGQSGDVSNVQVRYLAVEEGVYDVATHGVKMEAVKFTSNVTDTTGSFVGETRTMAHNLFDHYFIPTVFGQVMSYNDTAWSTFWYKQIKDKLQVGKHVGEDTNVTRANETVGYIIMEAGSLQIGDYRIQVGGLGYDAYNGFSGLSNSTASHDFTRFPTITSGLVCADISVPWGGSNPGDEGFWVVQKQGGTGNTIAATILEDQIADAEQDAGNKGGSYLLVSYTGNNPVTRDDSAVALEGFSSLIDLLGNDVAGPNGSLSITGLTQPTNGTVVDNGDGTVTYTPNASYTGPDAFTYTTNNGSGSDTAVVNVDVQASSISQSGIQRDKWTSVSGGNISDLTGNANYPDSPTSTSILTSFEAPTGDGDSYGQRLTGYLVPPTTGDYTFWIASDDDGDLYLSTDHQAANASRIAYVDGWTSEKAWTAKSSQTSATISLEAGKAYYIEAIHKEGGGGDHLAVAWQGPGIAQAVIDGQYLYTLGNSGPSVANAVADVQVNEDAADTVLDLSNVFADSDVGDPLTIELAGNTNGALVGAVLNGTQLTLSYAPGQYGTAQISVRALDRLNTVAVDTFQVEVVHVNMPPVLGDAVFAVAEDVSVATTVGSVVGSDPDAGDVLTYSITAGNTGGAFAIDSNSGLITVASGLNYEAVSSYALTVQVSDVGGLTDTATVTVNVSNVDTEDSDGDGVLDALEIALGTDPNSAASTPGSSYVNLLAWMKMEEGTGTTSADSSGYGRSGALSGSPSWMSGYVGSHAIDFDGVDDTLTVSPSLGVTSNTATISGWIKRNGAQVDYSGVVFMRGSGIAAGVDIAGNTLRYHWDNGHWGWNSGLTPPDGEWCFFSLVIEPTKATMYMGTQDGVLQSAENVATHSAETLTAPLLIGQDSNSSARRFKGGIDDVRFFNRSMSSADIQTLFGESLLNSAPNATDASFNLAEGVATGSSVGTVTASDININDTLSYAITAGNTGGEFAINSSTGEITTVAVPDYETVSQYVLTVSVADDGAPVETDTATITVNVTNVNEAPVANATGGSIAENVASGASITTVVANDPDAGDSLSYAITSGNAGGEFAINSGTGEVTTTTALDYETAQQYVLTVTVSDAGLLADTATVTIDVTDVNEAPTANDASGAVAENLAPGTSVASVVASDPDAGDALSYTISSGNTGNAFAIDSLGNITTAAALNFEAISNYLLTVTVTDSGSLSDTATINVTVNDLNEAPVANDTSGSIAEDAAIGSAVATVMGSDVDAGSVLSYAITAGNTGGAFLIDSSGHITTATTLDFETVAAYSLTVLVTDNGALTDTANVSITVTDVLEVTTPSVATGAASNLTQSSADVAYSVTDDGGEDPTLTLYYGESDGGSTAGNWTNSQALGTQSTGAYNTTLSGLTEGTAYYFTVHASNSAGESWGASGSFTTAADTSPKLVRTTVSNVSNSSWTSVDLGKNYNSAVIVATPIYDGTSQIPVVTRITNVSGSGFDLKIDRVDGLSTAHSVDVSIIAVEEGVYTQATDGVTMEAVKYTSTVTAENNSWVGESKTYQNTYTSPVVVGQVMSANDANWSVFWSMGNSRTAPASASALNVGKHVGEDPNTSRANETVGYIVIESGSGVINGVAYEAALGADSVRGLGNSSSPYTYSLSGNLSSVSAAAVSISGMDGNNGAWAALSGSPALTTTSIGLHAVEDQLNDSEMSHTTTQVGYLIVE